MFKKLLASFLIVAFFGLCADAAIRLHGGGITGTPGTLGTGLNFATINQAIIKPNASLQVNGPFTISAIIKTTQYPSTSGATNPEIYNNGPNFPTNGFFLYQSSSNNYTYLQLTHENLATYNGAFLNTDGLPHLITGVWDGSAFCLIYLSDATHNASLMDKESCPSYAAGTSFNFFGSNQYPETLIDIRYCSSAMSQNNISQLWGYYAQGLTPPAGAALGCTLAANYPLSSSTIHLSGSPLNGTIDDTSGNSNTAYVDTTPPSVAITSPSAGNVSGTVTLTATASDNVGVASVEFLLDGVIPIATLTSGPYTTTWDSTQYIDHAYTIEAIATDIQGNTANTSVSITTNNSIAARNFYFAAAGSNSNNCLSTGAACQTIAKMLSLTYRPGDTINFNGGDSFTSCFTINQTQIPSGGLPALPIVMGPYGTGVPHLLSNCSGTSTNAFTIDSVSGFTLTGFLIDNNGQTASAAGLVVQNSCGSSCTVDTVVISGNEVKGFVAPGSGNFSAEINVNDFAFPAGVCGPLKNVSIINNNLHGSSGVTSADDNGLGGLTCGPSNNTNMIVQGNTVDDIGGHATNGGVSGNGIVRNGGTGLLDQFNLTHDNGANVVTCGGPGSNWLGGSANLSVQKFNEMYNQTYLSGGTTPANPGAGACDQIALDMDLGVSNSIAEYNYSHLNGGAHILMLNSGAGWNNNTARYNVSEQDNNYFMSGGAPLALDVAAGGVWAVYNNSIYYTATSSGTTPPSCMTGGFTGVAPVGTLLANNICQITGYDGSGESVFIQTGNGPNYTNAKFVGNDYYQTGGSSSRLWTINNVNYANLAAVQAAGFEAGSQVANPLFTSAGMGGTLTWTPSTQSTWPPATNQPTAYTLQGGSPAIAAGTDLTMAPYSLDVGTRDYYANSISAPFNEGAYQ